MQILVRKMLLSDINEVASIHLMAFKGFFLSQLGFEFLKIFYTAFLYSDNNISLVAVDEKNILGVVVGSLKPGMLYKKMFLRNPILLLKILSKKIIKNPFVILKIFRRVETISKFTKFDCELMSICVKPSDASKGIGKMLECGFSIEAKKKGCKTIMLTTDKVDNEKANNFYKGLGYRLVEEYITKEGRLMNRYVKKIL